MTMSADTIGGQTTTPDRYLPPLGSGYRGRSAGVGDVTADGEHRNGAIPVLEPGMERKPRLPSLDLEAPPEPVYSPDGWLDTPTGTLADHPLLRGLLLELPPKGAVPQPEWLDRWFEAARSILELLYVHNGAHRG
jgi:hypothetical protein